MIENIVIALALLGGAAVTLVIRSQGSAIPRIIYRAVHAFRWMDGDSLAEFDRIQPTISRKIQQCSPESISS